MSGAVGDHVAREEDARVHTVGRRGSDRCAVPEGGREVHTLEQSLGYGDGLLVAKEHDQLIEAASDTEPSEPKPFTYMLTCRRANGEKPDGLDALDGRTLVSIFLHKVKSPGGRAKPPEPREPRGCLVENQEHLCPHHCSGKQSSALLGNRMISLGTDHLCGSGMHTPA